MTTAEKIEAIKAIERTPNYKICRQLGLECGSSTCYDCPPYQKKKIEKWRNENLSKIILEEDL